MFALFDTNIYVAELTGKIPITDIQLWRSKYITRLSPVIYHELLRGSKHKELVEEIKKKTVMTPPPTQKMWEESAEVLRKFVGEFGFSEEIFKLQNDVLIALTAKNHGALVISQDRHFTQIVKIAHFHFLHYQPH